MKHVRQAAAKEGFFTKDSRGPECGNSFTGLEMWIENDFDNCENPTTFEGSEQFCEGYVSIWYFSKDSNQDAAIKAIDAEYSFVRYGMGGEFAVTPQPETETDRHSRAHAKRK